jgi:hypothetical protein
MSAIANPVPVISLSEVVQGDRIRVEISPEGHINVQTPGRVTTRGPASIPTSASVGALKMGAAMPDGSIYAGVSPDTGKPMFATPKDAPLTLTFDRAAKHAAKLDAHGHQDWRMPTKAELNMLFENRAAIGGFNEAGSYPYGWYWSSSRIYDDAWVQRFSFGSQDYSLRNNVAALRCVRG